MGVFKSIRIELTILILLTLSIFISFSLDLSTYNYFENFNNNPNNRYLKEFFTNITELGDSVWYFSICIVCILIFFVSKKTNLITTNYPDKIFNYFISAFVYLLVVGITTQIVKHLIGRPRPNYTNLNDVFNFNFLSFESNLHSFPSGHSSTIFIVCLLIGAALPKLKYFFYFLASIVALSRVVVGAHFFTDVVAGFLLALIIFKILNSIVDKKYKNYSLSKIEFKSDSRLYYFILFLMGISLFFTIGPSLDLYISSLFYYGNSQFYLQSFDYLSLIFRDILLPCILIYTLVLPILGRYIKIKIIFFNYKFSLREIYLILFSQIFTLVFFVNLVLKNLWGRSRPGDIVEFDGSEFFTAWFEYSDACNTNCSFVSGDASVGFSIIILYFITKKIVFVNLSIVFGILLGIIRIIAGGHFTSDIVFAGLIIILSNLIIYKIYKKYYDY